MFATQSSLQVADTTLSQRKASISVQVLPREGMAYIVLIAELIEHGKTGQAVRDKAGAGRNRQPSPRRHCGHRKTGHRIEAQSLRTYFAHFDRRQEWHLLIDPQPRPPPGSSPPR